ncbi:MAG: NAD(P)-dependent oxidoreductase [Candidatus Omnitrophota bacterium]
MALNKKITCIAGATGMVGSSILSQLLIINGNAQIRASSHNAEPLIRDRRIEYIRADLRSLEDCKQMLRGCGCLVMAAGYGGGAKNTRAFPWQHINENLTMNKQVLEAACLEGVRRVILISSATLYQEFSGNVKEDQLDWNKDPHEAHFAFGWTMRFIEKLCMFVHKRYGIEVIIARAANIFGPFDKFNPEISNFIPALIRKATDKLDPFEVWGSPDVVRDVLYSEDLARAITAMLEKDNLGGYGVFNLGSGRATTVGEVVQWALKYAQHTPTDIKYAQDKPVTIKSRILDCGKAADVLGWRPQYTIEEGIRKTTQWWMENKKWWKK